MGFFIVSIPGSPMRVVLTGRLSYALSLLPEWAHCPAIFSILGEETLMYRQEVNYGQGFA